MKFFLNLIIKILEFFTAKKFIYFTPGKYNGQARTAAKTRFGFWLVGNVFDTADAAYGIANNGSVESFESALVLDLLRQMPPERQLNFYDIGANVGYYSLLALCSRPLVRAYAFEPVPQHVACIKESASLNHWEESLSVFECALGNSTGQSKLFISGSGSSFHKEFVGRENLPIATVAVKRLDDVIVQDKLPSPDFIKIDVEGFEWEVLQGAGESIDNSHPIIFVEIAKSLESINRKFVNIHYGQILEFFEQKSYTLYCCNEGGLVKVQRPFSRPGVNMFLALHSSHSFLNATVSHYERK